MTHARVCWVHDELYCCCAWACVVLACSIQFDDIRQLATAALSAADVVRRITLRRLKETFGHTKLQVSSHLTHYIMPLWHLAAMPRSCVDPSSDSTSRKAIMWT